MANQAVDTLSRIYNVAGDWGGVIPRTHNAVKSREIALGFQCQGQDPGSAERGDRVGVANDYQKCAGCH